MRETSFIKQNKEKWQQFDQILEGQDKDPDELNDLFVQITDDLSYSRTFYPNRSVRVYLNGLAQRIFFSIYKNRKSHRNRLFSFWAEELPQLVYEARKEFRISFLVFVMACGIGALSCAMDAEFAEVILGADYVSMTVENIESGDPMAVYKQKGQLGMSIGITANNLFVAFLTFVMGVFLGIGTIVILIRNGIMLGAFQYFFIERELFWESFLTIWIHGTLEISAIIIAGAAGLTMGKGLAFPGTYTRLQAFQKSARRGLKIMVGIAPIIILAGFIEGYLTRHTGTPDMVRGLFILVCLLTVLIYFVWYPRIKAKIGFKNSIKEAKIPPTKNQKIDFTQIKSTGVIFSDIFIFYRKYFGKVAVLTLLTTSIFTGITFLFSGQNPDEIFYFSSARFGILLSIEQFFRVDTLNYLPFVAIGALAILLYRVNDLIIQEKNLANEIPNSNRIKNFLKALGTMAMLYLLIATNDWYTVLIFLFLAPLILLWGFINQKEGLDLFNGLRRSLSLGLYSYMRVLGLFFLLSLLGIVLFSIMDTTVFWFFLDLIGWVIHFDQEIMDQISVIALTFTGVYLIHLIFTLLLIGVGIQYFTLLEIKEAPELKKNNFNDRYGKENSRLSKRGNGQLK